MRETTNRQPGYVLVELVGLDRYDEPLTALLSRVPSVGEDVQIEDDPPQKVQEVRHRLHPAGRPPHDNDVDAVIVLRPIKPRTIPRVQTTTHYT